jgi:predicted secreted Zn-dependent protease
MELRQHQIQGRSAPELVAYLRGRPLPLHNPRSPNLGALATLSNNPSLDLQLTGAGGICRVVRADLDFRFVMTLPTADPSTMDARTGRLWSEFETFARRHEETHRAIYVAAGRRFLAAARDARRAGSCAELKGQVEAMLDREYERAMAEHVALDRRDGPRLLRLGLFVTADRGN